MNKDAEKYEGRRNEKLALRSIDVNDKDEEGSTALMIA